MLTTMKYDKLRNASYYETGSIGSKNTYVFTNNKLFANHIGIFCDSNSCAGMETVQYPQKTYSSVLFLAGEVPP